LGRRLFASPPEEALKTIVHETIHIALNEIGETGDAAHLGFHAILPVIYPELLHRRLLGKNTLKEVQADQGDLQGFFPPLASDVKDAKRFLSHQEVRESLVKASNVLRLLSLSHSESRIHLVGKASRESIELLLNLALSCGGRFG